MEVWPIPNCSVPVYVVYMSSVWSLMQLFPWYMCLCTGFEDMIDKTYGCFVKEGLTTKDLVKGIADILIDGKVPMSWAGQLGSVVPLLIMKGLKAMVAPLPSTPSPPSPSVFPPAVPAPGMSMFKCGGFPIELSVGKKVASGVLLGSFVELTAFDQVKHEVVIKLDAPGRDLSKESTVLTLLKDSKVKSVVRIYAHMKDEPSPYLVIEYGGDCLATWMTSDVDIRKLLAKQIVQAVSHIHAHGVMHGDLKPDNILVIYKPEHGGVALKLCDFDSARVVDNGSSVPQEFPHNGEQLKWTPGEIIAILFNVFYNTCT